MTQHPRVALFSVLVVDEWPSPSTQLRFLLPWARSSIRLVDGHMLQGASGSGVAACADVLVFQRLEIARHVNAEVIAAAQRTGLPVVVDLDDDFLALSRTHDHEASVIPEETLRDFRARLATVDQIWVANEQMLDSYQQFGRPTLLRPTVPPPLGSARAATDAGPLRVLYFGTQTHQRDWRMVEAAVHGAQEAADLDVTMIGISGQQVVSGVRVRAVPGQVISRYVAFMDFVRRCGPFHVGIAPLVPDEFSEGKSSLKLYEYLAMGLLPVASPVGPYAWLRDVDPRLTPGSARDWRETLVELAEDRGLVSRLLEVVRTHCDVPALRRQVLTQDEERLIALCRQTVPAPTDATQAEVSTS